MADLVEIKMNKKLRDLLSGVLTSQLTAQAKTSIRLAANRATAMSRDTFTSQLRGREHIPARQKRPTTGGSFASHLRWNYTTQGGHEQATFNVPAIESVAPYWIIQEVGTGRSFNILGPSAPGASAISGRIKNQRGRRLPLGLQWGVGGAYTPPGGFDGGQIQPLANLSVPRGAVLQQFRIRREIEGKHFVRRGGQEGFRWYEQNVRSEVRRLFQ